MKVNRKVGESSVFRNHKIKFRKCKITLYPKECVNDQTIHNIMHYI